MRILILTCATGGGHLRAAAALEKYIRETTTHEVIQMDFLKSIGKLLDKTICDSYLFMAKKTPSLFGRLYKTTNKDNPLADFVPRTTELLALQFITFFCEFPYIVRKLRNQIRKKSEICGKFAFFWRLFCGFAVYLK